MPHDRRVLAQRSEHLVRETIGVEGASCEIDLKRILEGRYHRQRRRRRKDASR
jgi:hypothetical protein